MRRLILFLFLLASVKVFSQGPAWIWAKNPAAGVPSYVGAEGKDLTVAPNGDIYLCGYFDNKYIVFGTDTLSGGDTKILVVKYDSSGTPLWTHCLGGTGNDDAIGIAADGAGNAYVTGYFEDISLTIGSTTLTNNGQNNYYFVKYDANGNVLWVTSAGGIKGNDNAGGASVAIDNSGYIYVTGDFTGSNISFGTDTIKDSITNAVFITKYDASGNVIWVRYSSNTEDGGSYSITTDANDNVFVTGYFSNTFLAFDTDTLINASKEGNDDMFLVKYDKNGNLLWARNSLDSGWTYASSVVTDGEGNAYVTGGISSYYDVFGADTLDATKNSIAFLIKYSPSGNVIWAKGAYCTQNFPVSAGGTSLAIAPNGNIYETGAFPKSYLAFGKDTLINNEPYGHLYVAGYDTSGNELWAESAGENINISSDAIVVDGAGNSYLTGQFAGSVGFTPDTISSNYSDLFIAKLNPGITGVNELSAENGSVKVYPTPSTGVFNFQLENINQQYSVEVYNILGQQVYSEYSIHNTQFSIDLSNESKGVYLYRLIDKQGVSIQSGKLLLQ